MRTAAILPILLSLAVAACAGDGSTAAVASFDCAKAADPIELSICEDPQLSRLDSELAAIYTRAEADGDSVPSGNDLRIAQRQWVATRNRCGAEADPRGCLVKAYAARIQQLRMGSAAARWPEAEGITFGPFAAQCAGIADPLVATFINAEPNLVYLSWSEGTVVLTQAMSASGARYADATESTVFWNKGDSALFQRPGASETSCTLERI
ncbi:MAG TPA: MliC family protein [Kiloniellales bacterium]|nr:MliC family protein [Kiloniellales bacterium]